MATVVDEPDVNTSSSSSPAHLSNSHEPVRRTVTVQEKPPPDDTLASTNTQEATLAESNFTFYASAPPPLNYSITGVHGRRRAIFIWAVLFFIEAGILPLVLFYGIRWGTHLSTTINLAIITSLIGTVSGFKMTQRTYYLWIGEGHEHRRPIGSGRWGVDCFHALVGLAMCAFFIPLIIGSSLQPAEPPVVAMALPCVMIALGLPLLITGLFPHAIRLPVRVSSLPPGRPLPPLAYMYVEDVVAVDGGGGNEFRQAWRTRYEESRVMRRIIRDASIGWGGTGVLFGTALIIIDWTVPVDPGYGVSYGFPWFWATVGLLLTWYFVSRSLEHEHRSWVAASVHKERILPIEEGKYDRPSLDQVRRRASMGPPGHGNVRRPTLGSIDEGRHASAPVPQIVPSPELAPLEPVHTVP